MFKRRRPKATVTEQLTLDLRGMSDAERDEALRVTLGKPHKMNARAVEEDGYLFPSLAERDRYLELKLQQSYHLISDLTVHEPVFMLQEKFRDRFGKVVREIVYTPDFSYREEGALVLEEVKGGQTSLYKDFSLRIRLLKRRYPDADLWIVHMVWDRKTRTWSLLTRKRA